MVLGPNTKNLEPKPKYGTKRCLVECNLGSSAALYHPLNEDGDKVGTQLLVKVIIYPGGKDLNPGFLISRLVKTFSIYKNDYISVTKVCNSR